MPISLQTMKVAKIFNELNTYNFLLKYANKDFDLFNSCLRISTKTI